MALKLNKYNIYLNIKFLEKIHVFDFLCAILS